MRLSHNEEMLVRQYIDNVDKVVRKFVPNTVAGNHLYNLMMSYLEMRKKMGELFSLDDKVEEKKIPKWRQITLEEAINNEKKDNK